MDLKKKSRLGRGLSSLMNVGADFETTEAALEPVYRDVGAAAELSVPRGTPLDLSLDLIDANPRQPRREFDDASLAELAASIETNGVIQPIVVVARGERYELIAGERRLRASRVAGRTTIPAILREADALSQAQMALVENIQREDLNPIDRALGYRTLLNELGLTQQELGQRLGEDRSTIANHLRLLDLGEVARDHLRAGRLTLGHAKVLAGISDAVTQNRLAGLAVTQELSVRNLERAIATPSSSATDTAEAKKPSAHLRDLEVNLSKQLGLRVQVKAGANKAKGRLVIHYQTLDEFDALMEKVGVQLDA